MVPCQAGCVGGRAGVAVDPAAILLSCNGSGKSTMEFELGLPFGGTAWRIAQGLLTRGRISGNCFRSWMVGCHVRPSGGPKSAQVFNSLAMSLVVNFASRDV